MTRLDHLVYTAADLEAAVERIRTEWGCRVRPGGRHPRWGSRNAVVPLAGGAYLELIAPDPTAAERATIFGLDRIRMPGLATWAVRPSRGREGHGHGGAPGEDPSERPGLERLASAARSAGVEMGSLQEGSRRREDGLLLEWRLSDPLEPRLGGVVPFLIDWGTTPHPSDADPAEVELCRLELGHPEPGRIQGALRALGADRWAEVDEAPAPRLWARFRTPRGIMEIGPWSGMDFPS